MSDKKTKTKNRSRNRNGLEKNRKENESEEKKRIGTVYKKNRTEGKGETRRGYLGEVPARGSGERRRWAAAAMHKGGDVGRGAARLRVRGGARAAACCGLGGEGLGV